MFANYAWNAGATAANIVADLLALVAGADVAALSASCNKALTTRDGAASGWSVDDAAYGVLRAPCVGGGPASDKLARISCGTKIQLSTVDSWVSATHTAGYSTTAYDVSLAIAAAGSVSMLATPDVMMLAASDWSVWQIVAEIKREGPLMIDAAAPSWVVIGQNDNCYSPRLKNPAAAGETAPASLSLSSAYGNLTASTTRDRAEKLYIPMAPAVATVSGVPVGEFAGVMISGGYGQSGDYMMDAGGVQWWLCKTSSRLVAVKRV